MEQEIAIHDMPDDVIVGELSHMVEYFRGLGHERCRVLFGWHWGMDYYPTNRWDHVEFALDQLQSEVQKAQDTGIGRIGGDDLHISIPTVECEFCFCHHSGIHLSFDRPSNVTGHFLERWGSASWTPIEK